MKLFNHPALFLALGLVIRAYSLLNIPIDVNLPSVQDDVAHKNLAPRDYFYDQSVVRGKAFLEQFTSNRYSAPITGGTIADSGFQGWEIKRIRPPQSGSTPDEILTEVLQDLLGGRLRNQYYGWRADISYQGKRASYKNLYGPSDGVIAALDNYNSGVTLPMSHWSELSWRIWAESCESASVDPKTLKYVIRHEVANGETLVMFDQIYRKEFPHVALGDRIILLPSGRTLEAFQALLGSPNGRGVAWMLLNKRNVLGKTIAKITVEWVKDIYADEHVSWDMWFELQEVAVAPPAATNVL